MSSVYRTLGLYFSVMERGRMGCQAASLTRQAGCQPAPCLFARLGSLAAESARLADIQLRRLETNWQSANTTLTALCIDFLTEPLLIDVQRHHGMNFPD